MVYGPSNPQAFRATKIDSWAKDGSSKIAVFFYRLEVRALGLISMHFLHGIPTALVRFPYPCMETRYLYSCLMRRWTGKEGGDSN